METELNIVEILKDKPKGTKLYSPLFGDVYLLSAKNNAIKVEYRKEGLAIFFGNGKYYNYPESELLLFPSKEMRDWSKFAWKKGDVLINRDKSLYIIFEEFEDDTYISFKGKHYLLKGYDHYSKEEDSMVTSVFEKADNESAQAYINAIEKRLGGKLNMETLEIEANVNIGDVVTDSVLYGICTKVDNSNVYCDFGCNSASYNSPITKLCLRKEDIHVVMSINKEIWYKEIEKKHHISIDRNTLKVQSEFKDGDILFSYNTASIFIFSGFGEYKGFNYYVALDRKGLVFSTGSAWCNQGAQVRYALSEEKQRLFIALAKKGKAWDAEKKEIVDLQSKVELKPFDKVLVRDNDYDTWQISLFGYKNRNHYYCCNGNVWNLCIPYKDNECLLGTTKDVES